MSVLMEVIEQIYCDHCHLATPAWKRRCIHCSGPSHPAPDEKKITGKRS